MDEKLNSDEWRLIRFFRCLQPEEQSDILHQTGALAIEERIPDKGVYELMPDAAGVKPEGREYLFETNSIAYVIYCGIEATGDPFETLLGSSYFDEEYIIPQFTEGAEEAALKQDSFFNYNEDFAREYIDAWRQAITLACLNSKPRKPV